MPTVLCTLITPPVGGVVGPSSRCPQKLCISQEFRPVLAERELLFSHCGTPLHGLGRAGRMPAPAFV